VYRSVVWCKAGEEWRRLTTADKAPYEQRAEEERRKYEQAMKEYNMVSVVSHQFLLSLFQLDYHRSYDKVTIIAHCSGAQPFSAEGHLTWS